LGGRMAAFVGVSKGSDGTSELPAAVSAVSAGDTSGVFGVTVFSGDSVFSGNTALSVVAVSSGCSVFSGCSVGVDEPGSLAVGGASCTVTVLVTPAQFMVNS